MIQKPSIPRIVIAGTHSGCGKTTVARGIMEALTRRGYTVQPFKVGPDFIDPTHHSAICRRVSRNLDAFMMGEDGVTEAFRRASAGADIAVIEGVMGMYDGVDGCDLASTAHVMRILSAPALLVADARGMSRSVHALVKGFLEFEPGIKIGGVVFNRIGSPRHRELIEYGRTVPAVGYLPRTPGLEIESRHLGLAMAHETAPTAGLGELMEEHCDIDQVIRIAGEAPPLPAGSTDQQKRSARARIGVAMDEAFCFYYQDNLDLLERSGARLVFFSLSRDEFPDLDAVYIGGGYPELHAAALESSPCKKRIAQAASDGMPVYAECGGLLYLCESLETDMTYRMAGILPADARMTERVVALGYSEGTWSGGPALAPPSGRIIGHEFHYSQVDCRQDARFSITLTRGRGIANGKDGMYSGESLAAYMHAYFPPSFAMSIVDAASAYRRT
ncbi:MAG: cobyrinic acid a,c-diamide synthase [Methanoregulaceae archaeon PtaU1.Bin059]|nr:MAG: cobyrinic acid a,c-diamide synthase [Methanoregulaceae archaeon PtaB.Bin152]OPY41421.1 MAG: cobyrinic acid a,c-diamide synthase [Methanoregulaceae archaeon PtaU1.Bin059]